MVTTEAVKRITDFIKNLTGIKWGIVIDKSTNSLTYMYKVISDDQAQRMSSIFLEMSNVIEKLRGVLSSIKESSEVPQSMCIRLGDNIIEIEEYLDYIYVLYGDNRLYNSVSLVFDRLRRRDLVKCGVCNKDLTLATYICPRCGRSIPFIVSRCPYCGYNVRIKRCPYCKAQINSINGKRVYRSLAVLATSVTIGFIIIGASIYVALMVKPPIYEIGVIGSLIGVLVMYIGKRVFSRIY